MTGIRVVFHIDESENWPLLLGNVLNLLEGLEPDEADIRVVANSRAVQQYANGQTSLEAMARLQAKGVRFQACRNALRALGMHEAQLHSFVEVVPAGVRELIDRQREGFAYIKP